MLEQSLKNIFISRIKKTCGACTIYLFGSHAYGEPKPSSDIDIAVIMDKVESSIKKAAELWDVFKDIPMSKDFIVASRDEFDFYKNEPGSIFRTISEKGVALSEN